MVLKGCCAGLYFYDINLKREAYDELCQLGMNWSKLIVSFIYFR